MGAPYSLATGLKDGYCMRYLRMKKELMGVARGQCLDGEVKLKPGLRESKKMDPIVTSVNQRWVTDEVPTFRLFSVLFLDISFLSLHAKLCSAPGLWSSVKYTTIKANVPLLIWNGFWQAFSDKDTNVFFVRFREQALCCFETPVYISKSKNACFWSALAVQNWVNKTHIFYNLWIHKQLILQLRVETFIFGILGSFCISFTDFSQSVVDVGWA